MLPAHAAEPKQDEATLNFVNADIESVIRAMGPLTGKTFLIDPKTFTMPMVLRGMIGQYAAETPWSQFAAMSLLMSIPAVAVFFFAPPMYSEGLINTHPFKV